jgi:hypothetical protein
MSLQLIAKQMEAKGRNGDSVLVHMTQDEVAGLQKLAEAAGGSLSVNPETGLVEANFLKEVLSSRILPTVVGMGLAATGVGIPLAVAGGALTGGIQAKRNDQDVLLGAGLGALGAYGGAGIGAGLNAAGSAAAQSGAMQAAATQQAGAQAAQQAAVAEGAKVTGAEAAQTTAQQLAADQAQAQAAQVAAQDASAQAINQAGADAATKFGEQNAFSQAGQGVEALAGQPGRDAFMTQVGGGAGLAKSGAAMYGAAAMTPEKVKEEKLEEDDEMIRYDYDPGRTYAERDASGSSAERDYFGDRRFTNRRTVNAANYFAAAGGAIPFAEGGATGGAGGGMSGASADAMSYLMGAPAAQSAAPTSSQAGLAYLMGQSSQSPVMQQQAARAAATPAPTMDRAKSTIDTTKGYQKISEGPYAGMYQADTPKYGFDPASQQYYRTDSVFEYVPPPPPTDNYAYQDSGGAAQGGVLHMAKGGLASLDSGGFILPADIPSLVGEGNTEAGYDRIRQMIPEAQAIRGKDGGQADTVPALIGGRKPARVAHGEMHVSRKGLENVGGGDAKRGADRLYAMMDRVREQATGRKQQIKPVNLKKALA